MHSKAHPKAISSTYRLVSMGHISSFTREFCNKNISDYTSTINSKGQSAEPVGTGCD